MLMVCSDRFFMICKMQVEFTGNKDVVRLL